MALSITWYLYYIDIKSLFLAGILAICSVLFLRRPLCQRRAWLYKEAFSRDNHWMMALLVTMNALLRRGLVHGYPLSYHWQALLEAGCSVEAGANLVECETPLQLASAAGHIEMVTLLLQHGADPHRITYFNSGSEARNRFTAYSLAASHGRRWLAYFRVGVAANLKLGRISGRGNKILSLWGPLRPK